MRPLHRAPLRASRSLLALTCAAALGCDERAPSAPPAVTDVPARVNDARAAAPRARPAGAASEADQQTAFAPMAPAGDVTAPPANVDPVIWRAVVPEDNAMTAERVALGRRLYFERRLSADGSVSCATCHDVTRGFTDQRPVSEGIRQQLGRRNAPTTLNTALLHSFFLDGRAPTLEAQAKLPIINPVEMGHPNGEAAARAIAGDAEYQAAFQRAYGRAVNYDDIGRAIAAFERTLVLLDAPFDRFTRGEAAALSEDARAGWELFNGEARCVSCHTVSPTAPLFTDERFHNVGVAARHQDFVSLARRALGLLAQDDSADAIDRLAIQTDMSELGRFMVTRNTADVGAFRTSQLRNVGVTAPYMHDGSVATLWDVMDHYNKGGEANPYLDGGVEPLDLSEREIDQLVAFMFSLTSDRLADQNREEMARQRALAARRRPLRDDALAHRRRLPFEPATSTADPGETPTQGSDP